MKTARKLLATVFASLLLALAGATAALAQTPIDPSATVTENESATAPLNPFGISISLAMMLGLTGLLVVLIIIIRYMRYAPRFSQDEESMKVVRADRVRAGTGAPSPQRRHLAGRAGASWRPRPCRRRSRPPRPQRPCRRGRPGSRWPSPPQRPLPRTCRRIRPSAGRRARPPPPAPAPAPAATEERPEVSLDQEVFERPSRSCSTQGTDRRVAEGKARRAAMIAARKKAAGEA